MKWAQAVTCIKLALTKSSSFRTVPSMRLAPPVSGFRHCFVPQTLCPVRSVLPILPKIYYTSGGPGLPMDQLLNADRAALLRIIPLYDDQKILLLGLGSIRFRILWPGYEHMNFYREIYLSMRGGGGVSCAGELAVAVADTYSGFLQQAVSWTPQGTSNRDWFLTKGSGFTLRDFGLVSVNHMGDDIFQAEVELRTWRAGISYASPAALTAVRHPPPIFASKGHSTLALPTPALPVTIAKQRKELPEPAPEPDPQTRARFRQLYALNPQKYRGEVKKTVAQVDGLTAETMMDWSMGPVTAEDELPGPTGGLMYPDSDK
ncbi:hypothetical protein L226DRAFT_563287 [Lentinus tigrinus ALCF2SS1-7]|uniref:Uncharacterized protein n=1 Tax=Lentinus tigrinus ALCF2SS1-6 TaxID=1328759 RepID=A0A5C2RRB7_9APHY|nr:hypothetical protein L227DRAFT_604805 [Lentinus tigrinus ALCF2SS1-6]RPD69677.1 hypothetical protein L226DRAFT_563287 [Lentinus tigrinus ALCF2SS1-7]